MSKLKTFRQRTAATKLVSSIATSVINDLCQSGMAYLPYMIITATANTPFHVMIRATVGWTLSLIQINVRNRMGRIFLA
jgi:hypothetical protein